MAKRKRPFEVLAVNEANAIEVLIGYIPPDVEHKKFVGAVEELLLTGARKALDAVCNVAADMRQSTYKGSK